MIILLKAGCRMRIACWGCLLIQIAHMIITDYNHNLLLVGDDHYFPNTLDNPMNVFVLLWVTTHRLRTTDLSAGDSLIKPKHFLTAVHVLGSVFIMEVYCYRNC